MTLWKKALRLTFFLGVFYPFSVLVSILILITFLLFRYSHRGVFLVIKNALFACWVQFLLASVWILTGSVVQLYLPSERALLKRTLKHLSPTLLNQINKVSSVSGSRSPRASTTSLNASTASLAGGFRREVVEALRKNACAANVIIANHQLFSDWIYLWVLSAWSGRAGQTYFILKRSLQFIPILGITMKAINYIFLARDWQRDEGKFRRRIRRMESFEPHRQLVIFPEGTTPGAQSMEQMHRFAARSGLSENKHCLLPRVTGLRTILANKPGLHGILDLTIAYEGVTPIDEATGRYPEDQFGLGSIFLEGRAPACIHILVEYIPRNEFVSKEDRLPSVPMHGDTEAFTAWLIEVYRRKDRLMEEFYTTGAFRSECLPLTSTFPISPVHAHALLFVSSMAAILIAVSTVVFLT